MTAQKLDGKATAAAIKSELAERVAVLRDQGATSITRSIVVSSITGGRLTRSSGQSTSICCGRSQCNGPTTPTLRSR
jgi:hypothetical protein